VHLKPALTISYGEAQDHKHAGPEAEEEEGAEDIPALSLYDHPCGRPGKQAAVRVRRG